MGGSEVLFLRSSLVEKMESTFAAFLLDVVLVAVALSDSAKWRCNNE